MIGWLDTARFVLRHPLNRNRRLAALGRWVRWQVASRLLQAPVAIPFVDSTRLLVSRGMTGATGNIYCGLHEFEDMAFVLHALRPGDLFIDVGANVGSYTLLAAGGAGADCLSFEPHPGTFAHLLDNVRLNDLQSRVDARNVALGARHSSARLTADQDTTNHILTDSPAEKSSIEIRVEPLDAFASRTPEVIKIDVEGFETEVLAGGERVLRSPGLTAVIMELNGAGNRYGYDETLLRTRMGNWGFAEARYDPFTRSLVAPAGAGPKSGNTLFVRNPQRLRDRLAVAPSHRVLETIL
jgi:FkbM family methyltransferase